MEIPHLGNVVRRFVPDADGIAGPACRIAGLVLTRIAALLPIVLWTIAEQVDPAGVQVVGPGVLSAGEIFRGSFTPDAGTLFFFTRTGAGETYRIHSSERTPAGWTTPTVVNLGGMFSDLYPAISPDGRRMVFSSYRPVPGQSGGKPSAYLWYADRIEHGWSAPVFMARTSTLGHYHSWVEFGFDGAIYFRRTTPDWKQNVTMRARWTGTEYSMPQPYTDVERWKGWRPDVTVVGGSPGPEGRLVFLDVATTNPRTGRAASDIWISMRRGDGWTDPAPLGAGINSDGYDTFPFVSPDGTALYFVRDFTTFLRIPLAHALASLAADTHVRYIANSGMLLSVGERRFLIDAPIRNGIPPYATSSAAERTRLEAARPPYDAVDALLVTHWHEDHFSAEAVAAHLSSSPRTIFVSSPEVVDRLRAAAPSLPTPRLRAVLPEPGRSVRVEIAGVPIHVLRIHHNPARRLPEQHVGFLIGGPAPVLHVGDADPTADNFALLKPLPQVDLAFLPFWYLADDTNRRFVADVIRPRRLVAMHIPPGDVSKVGAALRAANVTATIPSDPGASLAIGR